MSILNFKKTITIAFGALALALVLGVQVSGKNESVTAMDWAYQGSVTACFEQKAVANEIEISKSSIERATRKVMGFVHEVMPEEEASPEVCGMKLA